MIILYGESCPESLNEIYSALFDENTPAERVQLYRPPPGRVELYIPPAIKEIEYID